MFLLTMGCRLGNLAAEVRTQTGKVHKNKVKFLGPGKPFAGLLSVTFTPQHYTVTEHQPVEELCVTQDDDKTAFIIHTGRHSSEQPWKDFSANIVYDQWLDTLSITADKRDRNKLNFAFEGLLSM